MCVCISLLISICINIYIYRPIYLCMSLPTSPTISIPKYFLTYISLHICIYTEKRLMNGYLHVKTITNSAAHTTASRTMMTINTFTTTETARRENGNIHKVTIVASPCKHTMLRHIICLLCVCNQHTLTLFFDLQIFT